MTTVAAPTDRSMFLRRLLSVIAATCVAVGLLLSLGSDVLAPAFALPRLLLEYVGLSLFPMAAFNASVAARDNLSRSSVWVVSAGNLLWILGSAAVVYVA